MGKHAIIVIKNEKNEYLQYYDKRWNSYLFLNCKMNDKLEKNPIKEKLISDLKLKSDDIDCTFIGEKQHKKYSESDKIEKEYEHFFFILKAKEISNYFEQKCFEIDDIKYKWFSYIELSNDERIQRVNSDIVNYIKEFNL